MSRQLLSVVVPEVTRRTQYGHELSVLVWRLPEPLLAVSSAPLGGGLGPRRWVLNAQVPHDYDCNDPRDHLTSLAAEHGLNGTDGVGMLTAVDVRDVFRVCQEGIAVDATVGISQPQWAAAEDGPPAPTGPSAGTVNIVAFVPERLSEAALVNAVSTATEAKAQAMWEAGIAGTGTASDALCVLCPLHGEPHAYGGPRSLWGARLARAVHRAVLAGCQPMEPA